MNSYADPHFGLELVHQHQQQLLAEVERHRLADIATKRTTPDRSLRTTSLQQRFASAPLVVAAVLRSLSFG